eukprot:TRINITY_DN4356_c0_g4_i1.p1 TRINITY_DN4356_c0_g4~~TRINITY_DN4356_c0_g4_i1.p1  ORF type:complete len:688 (+),score=193.99 TRINITY_DN4356_c0_g4_i1:102-2165(+)
MPRKAAKRKAEESDDDAGSSVFDGITMAVGGTFTLSQKEVKDLIESNGGTVAGSVTKAVTHLITTDGEYAAETAKIKAAKKNGIFILSESFLHDSIKAGKLADPKKYPIGDGAGAASAEEEESEEEKKPAKKTKAAPKAAAKKPAAKKAKEESVSEEEEEEEKKPAKKAAPAKAAAPAKVVEEAPQARKIVVKGAAAVDSIATKLVKQPCHVLQEGADVYDCMLNQTEIAKNNNKFYVIQVLESDAGGSFWIWNRWGRVGLDGQNSLQSTSKAGAISAFNKKFYDKTKNQWANRASFKKQSGLYELVEMDYGAGGDDDEADNAPAAAERRERRPESNESRLPKRVQDLIKLIADIRMMENTMKEFEIDMKKMPLGKISKTQITKGYEILKKIMDVLDKKSNKDLLELSNRFYTAIPHHFGMRPPPVIRDAEVVKAKMGMLEALADMEIAATVLKSDQSSAVNPIDQSYDKLKCDMTPLDKAGDEFGMIVDYVANTHGSTHGNFKLEVEDVFKIARDGEDSRYQAWAKNKNRQLLWHGSRLTNWVGILSQGLRIAPPEAPATGYMFGKGVYFADMVSKSANYCCTSKASPVAVMLLSEVALGEMYEIGQAEYMLKAPPGKQSTKGCGRYVPHPAGARTLENGTIVPMGKQFEPKLPISSSLLYNEFIVYDTAQIQMRYLLKMRFHHKW